MENAVVSNFVDYVSAKLDKSEEPMAVLHREIENIITKILIECYGRADGIMGGDN